MLSSVRTPDTQQETIKVTPAEMQQVDKLDRAGTVASFLCALHCALMPLVITLLPLLGLGFLSSEPAEWVLLLASASLGVASICLGFREHRSRSVLALVGVAIALLVAARIFAHNAHAGHDHSHGHGHGHEILWMETILMVAGGVMMMSAHFINQKLCRSCRRCSSHECH